MKKHILPIIMAVALCGFVLSIAFAPAKKPTMVIDLPEEWQTISQDPTKPDLMVAYISCDTIYLRFDN